MNPFIRRITHLDSDHRLYSALGVAALVFLLTYDRILGPTQWVVTYVAYALVVIGLTWTTMVNVRPQDVPYTSRLEDSSRILIFMFVIVAAFASLFTVIILVRSVKNLSPESLTGHIGLSILAVICSWWLVHTVFTLRYAHMYYGDTEAPAGGLDFPNEKEPDFLDFAYFSFIIGMTSQVSDVQITSRPIRRLALIHGLLSFVFNAVIVALSINTISGLLGQ